MVISYACNPQIYDVDSEFVKYRKNNIYEENNIVKPQHLIIKLCIILSQRTTIERICYLNSLLFDAVFKKKKPAQIFIIQWRHEGSHLRVLYRIYFTNFHFLNFLESLELLPT